MIRAEPLAVKLTRVRKGEAISLPSVDSVGWTRQPAPANGVLIEQGADSVFVSWAQLDVVRGRK